MTIQFLSVLSIRYLTNSSLLIGWLISLFNYFAVLGVESRASLSTRTLLMSHISSPVDVCRRHCCWFFFFFLISQNHLHCSFNLKIFLCVGRNVCMEARGQLRGIYSFCHSDSEDWTQALSVGHEHLYPLSLLGGKPWIVHSKWHSPRKQAHNQNVSQ